MRIVLDDNDGTGWLAVTVPSVVTDRSFDTVFGAGSTVWIGPAQYAYAPCIELPSIEQGYFAPPDAGLVYPPSYDISGAMPVEMSVFEIGCLDFGPCAYRISGDDAATVLER